VRVLQLQSFDCIRRHAAAAAAAAAATAATATHFFLAVPAEMRPFLLLIMLATFRIPHCRLNIRTAAIVIVCSFVEIQELFVRAARRAG
jgi:hypothetical protein